MLFKKHRITLATFLMIGFISLFIGLTAFSAKADDIPNTGLSLGGRGAYYDPSDGNASWYGGAQLRLHLGTVFAVEGSVDYRRSKPDPSTRVDTYPVMASALLYLFPGRISPFILGGAGWYFTHVDGPGGDNTQQRFGLHAGGGLEVYLNQYWSIDGTYRYVWLEKIKSKDAALLDKDFNDDGHMVTVGLNYHF
ncbi:MAG TPA: porin family protein [Nitrospiria bacterium]|nr:porin family protein [Nitrospiria bacterium]